MLTRKARQASGKLFVENGGLYSFPTQMFKGKKNRFMEKVVPYIMDKMSSIDIDSASDLGLARLLFENK